MVSLFYVSIHFHKWGGVSIDCVTRGPVELRIGARTGILRHDAGGGVCGWIIHTSGSVGFDCLEFVCIGDKRKCLGGFLLHFVRI